MDKLAVARTNRPCPPSDGLAVARRGELQALRVQCEDLRAPRTVNADQISMNTQKLGIPSTVRNSDDHLIPARPSILPPLIERLAASHTDVLEKWNRNFGLDLRWPKAVAQRS